MKILPCPKLRLRAVNIGIAVLWGAGGCEKPFGSAYAEFNCVLMPSKFGADQRIAFLQNRQKKTSAFTRRILCSPNN